MNIWGSEEIIGNLKWSHSVEFTAKKTHIKNYAPHMKR